MSHILQPEPWNSHQDKHLGLPLPVIQDPNDTIRSQRRLRVVLILLAISSLWYTFDFGRRERPVISNRNPAYLIHAKHGAVASENVHCSELGVRVLKDGGNAIDAAVATTLCIGTINMFS